MVEADANLDDYDLWTLIALLSEAKQRVHWDTRVALIRERLEGGADPNVGRCAPLTTAAEMGHLAIVELLLEFGADVHGGCTARTPLAAGIAHPEIKACLLRHGAKETLFTAIAGGDVREVEACLQADAAAVHLCDEEDMTPLCRAAQICDVGLMRVLLTGGADPNVVADRAYGVSPVHHVCRSGCVEQAAAAIDLLVEQGVELDVRNHGGVTALHMAVRDRNVEAVRALLAHGAKPDVEDGGRRSTPLRRAVANTGKPGTSSKTVAALEITKLLLASGADPSHANRSGKSMLESCSSPEIRGLLETEIARRRR